MVITPVASLAGNALHHRVVIAISSLDELKVHRADPIKVSVASLDGERATSAHLHAPHMGPRCLEFGRDDGPHPVTRLEATYLLPPHLIPTREPFLRPVGSAMLAPSPGRDHQRFELARPDARQLPDAQGIEGMALLDGEPLPVPPGPPACPGADGQAEAAQGLDQLEPGRVHRRRVPEGAFGLHLHLGVAELGGGLVPFLLVAGVTGQAEIADAVGATATPGQDVIHFEGGVRLPAIGALVRVFHQQVGSGFPSGKRPLLIVGPRDLGILQQLGVEAHLLDLDPADGSPLGEPRGPGEGIAHPGEEGGREPASRDPPVGEAGRSVTQVGRPAPSPGVPLPDFVLMHLRASMADFAEKDA